MGIKAKVYTTVVRPVLVYGSECWGLKKKDPRKLLTTEMSMLGKMLGVRLRDKLRNEEMRRRTTVMTSVATVVEQNKLRWYGHVLRKKKEDVVKHVLEEPVRGKRSRGRQLIRWKDGLSERLEELSLREQDAKDRQRLRRGIMATDSQQREWQRRRKKTWESWDSFLQGISCQLICQKRRR